MKRPNDPRAGSLCTACNRPRAVMPLVRRHCASPTCHWWVCPVCGATNDATGANSKTCRDGTPKSLP